MKSGFAHGLAILLFFLGGVTYPLYRNTAVVVLLLFLAVVYGSLWHARARWLDALEAQLHRRRAVRKYFLALGSIVILWGGAEYVARFLVQTGLVEIYSPMETQLPEGAEDWRLAHITADAFREPDPVLWWRPVDRAPYNAQRMKGPVVSEHKPPGVFRILCYGDSNTDGPDHGGWPERLASLLQESAGDTVYEVVNAGVAGYSSHQGLLRFQRQVARFRPDLVLVSFGWNDLATALGASDATFQPPPPVLVAVERFLLNYRFYLVLKRYIVPQRPAVSVGNRVPLDDYLANMDAFGDVASAHGVKLVYLTRPYQEKTEAMRQIQNNWRADVPRYNDELVRFAAERNAFVIDVQQVFEDQFPNDFIDESHFTPKGHQRMAELLVERLMSEGQL